jgi:hypothetical protein
VNVLLKLTAITLMLTGEAMCIYAEMLVAKTSSIWWPFFWITLAGVPLLGAYYLGYKAFGSNMWPVMVVSMAAVLLSEPTLIWAMFKTWPSKQTLIGMVLGAAGFITVLTEKE